MLDSVEAAEVQEPLESDPMDMQKVKHEDGTTAVTLAGKPLQCQVCGHERFQEHRTLLNFGFSFLVDNSATTLICNDCGYIHSFFGW